MELGAGSLEGRRVRRRRSPEVAEKEIIAAAETFLWERPFRELTVDEVMRRTDLSRPSFYVYFKDRHHLVLRVVEQLGAELFTMADRWFKGEGDGPALIRQALEGTAAVYEEHGPVLKALAEAAADDPDVEAAYGGLVQSFVDATSRHIEGEIERGRIQAIDATQTAEALVWMTERALTLNLGVRPMAASPKVVVGTLARIWSRALY